MTNTKKEQAEKEVEKLKELNDQHMADLALFVNLHKKRKQDRTEKEEKRHNELLRDYGEQIISNPELLTQAKGNKKIDEANVTYLLKSFSEPQIVDAYTKRFKKAPEHNEKGTVFTFSAQNGVSAQEQASQFFKEQHDAGLSFDVCTEDGSHRICSKDGVFLQGKYEDVQKYLDMNPEERKNYQVGENGEISQIQNPSPQPGK